MLATFLFISLLKPGTTTMTFDALSEGKKIGHARVVIRESADGSYESVLDTTMTIRSKTLQMVLDRQNDHNGRPKSEKVTVVNSGQEIVIQFSYGAKVVGVQVSQAGKALGKREIPIPPKANLVDLSDRWFDTITPKVGEKCTFQSLSIAGKWETKTTAYKGKEQLNFNGKMIQAYVTESERSKQWLDDHGYPLKIDQMMGEDAVTLIRTSIKKS